MSLGNLLQDRFSDVVFIEKNNVSIKLVGNKQV